MSANDANKEGELDLTNSVEQRNSYLFWRVAMLDSIPHDLSVEHGLILCELPNAEVAILELRDGDARCIDGSRSSE